MKLFKIQNCDSCKAVVIPEGLNIEEIYVDDPSYNGFIPEQLPILQVGPGFNVNGEHFINNTLHLIKEAQDGVFRK